MSEHAVKIALPGNIIIAGATMSGKTWLTMHLMRSQLLKQVDALLILSQTMDLSGDFSEWREQPDPVKGLQVFKFTNPDMFIPALRDLVQSAESLMKHYNKASVPNSLVIIDDCVGHPILKFRGYLDQLSTRSRHLGISIVVLAQRLSAVPRTFRLNCKYIYLLSVSNFMEMERFLDECIPRKWHGLLRKHVTSLYDRPYTHILACCFARLQKDRMWINSELRLIDELKRLEGEAHSEIIRQ